MRIRAVAVVIDHASLLVVARQKDGRNYCVLPGGGVEEGETVEQACLRELREETGLSGTLVDQLPVPVDPDTPAVYFSVTVHSTKVQLGGPELARISHSNAYEPRWVPLDSLERIDLVPAEARSAVEVASPV